MDEMMDFGFPQTTESKILQECVMRMLRAARLTCVRTVLRQVHHPGVAQAGDTGAAAHGRHERGLVEDGGHQVPEERGLFGRDRERESAGACFLPCDEARRPRLRA